MSTATHPHLYSPPPFNTERYWELYFDFIYNNTLSTEETEELEQHSNQFKGTPFELANPEKDWNNVVGLVCFVSCKYDVGSDTIHISKGDVGILHRITNEVYWATAPHLPPMSQGLVNGIKGVHLPLFNRRQIEQMIERCLKERRERVIKYSNDVLGGAFPIL